MQRVIEISNMLRAVNIYWEVSLVILAIYFLAKCFTRLTSQYAVCMAMGLSLFAQIAYDWPRTIQDIMQAVIMGLIQCGFSIGLYSMADKYGWPEKLSGVVTRTLERKGGAA